MKKNGFTLIELVLTLSIIAILSTLIIPNMTNIKQKAQETALKNNCHTIQLALESYFLTHNSYPNGNNTHISSILTTLKDNNDITEIPKNPYTKQPFNTTDTQGVIQYSTTNNTYTLIAFGTTTSDEILTLSSP